MKHYALGIYEKAFPNTLSMAEKLRAAKKCGFDFLEFSADASDEKLARLDWEPERIYALKRECERIGLPITTMCLSGVRRFPIGSDREGIADKGVEIVKKAIDFSARIGIRIVQVGGFDVNDDYPSTQTSRKRFQDNLKICTSYAASKGVILGIETMENDFVNTIEKAMHYIKSIASPYLTVYPDTGNINNGTDNLERDILIGKGYISAAHLKETSPGVFRDLKFGEGAVDFDKAIRAYRIIGVNMFNAEFWYDGGDDWLEQAKSAHDFLAAKLDESDLRVNGFWQKREEL